ncbi:MAG: HdeD family acid-resistance protein [Anaerolineae bacterium]|nr:HdeD family acid-resistance protein [Anaerolineae bacterium]
MLTLLTRNWWVFALRGLFAVLFGVVALVWPQATLMALVLLFGIYALADGVFAVVFGIASYERNDRWWVMLLEGVAGIIIGLLTFFWPDKTALVLLYFIAAWALVTGVLEIVAAIELRRFISNEWMMILSGILSVVFGVLLVVFPSAGALSLVWLIGAYAIFFGILLISFAFHLRGLRPEAKTTGVSAS